MSLLSRYSIRTSFALSLSRNSSSRVSSVSLTHTSKSTDQTLAFGRTYSTRSSQSPRPENPSPLSPKKSKSSSSPPPVSSPTRSSKSSKKHAKHRPKSVAPVQGPTLPLTTSAPSPKTPATATATTTTTSKKTEFFHRLPTAYKKPSSESQSGPNFGLKHRPLPKPSSVSSEKQQPYDDSTAVLYNQYVAGNLAPINKAKPLRTEILPPLASRDGKLARSAAGESKDGGGSGKVQSRLVKDIIISKESTEPTSAEAKDEGMTEVNPKTEEVPTLEFISLARGFERILEEDDCKDGKMQFYKEPVDKGGVLLFEPDARKIPQPEALDVKKIPDYPTSSQLTAMESEAAKDSRPSFLSDPLYFSTLCALVYNSISSRPSLSDRFSSNFQNYRPISFNLVQTGDSDNYQIVEDTDLSVQPLKHFKSIDTIISKMMTSPIEQIESLISDGDVVDEVERTRQERAKIIELTDIYLGASRLYSSPNLPGNGEFSVKTKVTNRIVHDCMPSEAERVKKFDDQMELFQIERESSNLRDMVQDWFALRLEERQGLLTVFHNTSQLQGFEYRSINFIRDTLFSSSASELIDDPETVESTAESRFKETIIAVTEILQRISKDFKYHSDLNVIVNQREQNPLAIYVFSHGLSKESSASGKRAGKVLLGSYIYEYRNARDSDEWSPETLVTTRDIIAARDEVTMEMQDIGEALNRPANPLFLLSIYDPTDLLNLFDRRRDLAPGWRNPSLADGSRSIYRSSDGAGKGREIDAYTILSGETDVAKQPPPSFLEEQTNMPSTLPGLSFDLRIHGPKPRYLPWNEVLTSPPTASADAPVLANGLYTTDHSALFEIARKSKAWKSEMEPKDRNLVGEPNDHQVQMMRWRKLQGQMKSAIEKEFPAGTPSKPPQQPEPSNPTVSSTSTPRAANLSVPIYEKPNFHPKVDSEKALTAWNSAERARRRVVDFFAKEQAINPDAKYVVDPKTGHGLLNKPVQHKLLANFIKINPNASSPLRTKSSPNPLVSNTKSSAAAAIEAAVSQARNSSGNILHNSAQSQQRYRRSSNNKKKPKK